MVTKVLQNLVARIKYGGSAISKIVFNPPAEMREQKTETIQARISFEDIGEALREGLQRPGQIPGRTTQSK
jgi:hypothetical protein